MGSIASYVEYCATESVERAVCTAAYFGRDNLVRSLLETHGNAVASSTVDDSYALHYAALNGNEACVRILLEAGASADARDKDGECPLERALAECRYDVAARACLLATHPSACRQHTTFVLDKAMNDTSELQRCVAAQCWHSIDAQDNAGAIAASGTG
jgi:hypothetical protein